MIISTAEQLRELVRKILLAAGADQCNANCVAEHLVSADLSGVDTHGIWQLPNYVTAIRAGDIVPTAWPEIVRETPTSVLVSGNWTFGHVAAKYAVEVAIGKAKENNVAVAALVRSHHIGRLGYYAEMAAAQGFISMIWAGGLSEHAPTAAPYGGRKRVLHTNPMAMGFPAGEEPPMVLDFATTALSGVKVMNAYRRHEQLPPGCIIDRDGNPTANPNDYFAGGAYLPFGGHKGYALMMAVEFFGRIFTGSDVFAEAHRGGPEMRHQGDTFVLLRADIFQPFAEYAKRADELERRVRAVPSAPGFKEVLVPGDLEFRTRPIRRRDGIPIADDIWQRVTELAASLGVTDL